MGVIWLASYPKSGNTWVRFLVANLLAGSALETTERLQGLVPDIHDRMSASDRRSWLGQPVQLAKTHLVHRAGPPFSGATDGFIYIVRNPLDVLASAMNFRALTRPGSAPGGADTSPGEYAERFLASGGDPVWIGEGFGTWAEHVRSWREASAEHHHVWVRYEDMLADPHAEAGRVASFLGLHGDDGAVRAAVEASSFERMAAIERREAAERRAGFFGSRHMARGGAGAGVWFMHRGAGGGGRLVLSPQQVARAERSFGPLMRELGYDTSAS
jgi:aryl sulfotransferase